MERSEGRSLCRPAFGVTSLALAGFVQSAKPASARLVTPKAGLIIVLTTAASANLKTPCGRSKAVVPPANRFTSQAPHIASSVLPLGTASDVATLPALVTFTRNAPTKIAGQAR